MNHSTQLRLDAGGHLSFADLREKAPELARALDHVTRAPPSTIDRPPATKLSFLEKKIKH